MDERLDDENGLVALRFAKIGIFTEECKNHEAFLKQSSIEPHLRCETKKTMSSLGLTKDIYFTSSTEIDWLDAT